MHIKKLNKEEIYSVNALVTFYSLIRFIFHAKEEEKNWKEKEFVAIPIGSEIISVLARIRKTFPNKRTFLDVGCGKGNVMYLSRFFGFESKGIEFRKEYKEFHSGMDVFYGRAEKYLDYDKADIIYLYRPIKDDCHMQKLMDIIIKKSDSGTILIPVGFWVSTEKYPCLKTLPYARNTGGIRVYIKK
jgi:SAM-dependent methyltransferase